MTPVVRTHLSLPLVVIAGSLLVAACAATSTTGITRTTATARAEAARTRTDHETLATYFDEQAQAALKKVEECQQLRRRYERTPTSIYYPIGMAPAMLAHYDALIEAHRQAAGRYEALAKLHRVLAAEAEP